MTSLVDQQLEGTLHPEPDENAVALGDENLDELGPTMAELKGEAPMC